MNKPVKIMFVCLGNICRSPAAEGIFRKLVTERGLEDTISVESSGLGDWYIGHLPDERMREAAFQRGLILTSRAKLFLPANIDEFQYILGADQEVMQTLYKIAKTPEQLSKIYLMTAFSAYYPGVEIPDPYLQGFGSFELVLDMLEDSCEGLLDNILKTKF